jgi:hypothetical protein
MSDQSTSGTWRAECSDCSWVYEHSKKGFVEEAADNHQDVYRKHPDDHFTGTRYMHTGSDRQGGDS